MRSFFIAVQFLTCLPIKFADPPADHEVSRSLVYYPLVGMLIGVLLLVVFWMVNDLPNLIAAVILLAVWIVLTGGLHLDGLADSADAWVGGLGDKEKTLAIMKDPRCGSAAVVAIVLVLIIKLAALHTILAVQTWQILFLAPILGRAVIPLLFHTTPYVRQQGLGSMLAKQVSFWPGVVALVTVIVMSAVCGVIVVWALISSLLVFAIIRTMMMKRIGGCTGDTAGALVELVEVTVLLTLLIIMLNHSY